MDNIIKFKWIMKHCQINCRNCGDFVGEFQWNYYLNIVVGDVEVNKITASEILLWEMLK
ncbi:hypothetical protein Hanom_Chr12g01093341 [Helianthus anomalus]